MNTFYKYKEKILKLYNIKDLLNLIFTIVGLIVILILIRYFNISKLVNSSNIHKLKVFIENYGLRGQILYVLINVLCAILALPIVPVKFLGGLIYGPVVGLLLVELSSIIATAITFTISRYLLGKKVAKVFSNNKSFNKMYYGVENKGWKMIMITRLIPLFPYNLQNYGYGITNINFKTYILATAIFMITSNFDICYLAWVLSNQGNIILATILYLFVLIFITILSYIIKFYYEKN